MFGYRLVKNGYVGSLEKQISKLQKQIERLESEIHSARAASKIQDEIREIIDCPYGTSIVDRVRELSKKCKNIR